MPEIEPSPPLHAAGRTPIPQSAVDLALTVQFVVGWAGESGEESRLRWWPSDLVSEFGGRDLLRRLLPSTWEWAVLQGAREAARRTEAELRRQDHDPDRIVSLFHLGFEFDEAIEERLLQLKRTGRPPAEVLPGLAIINEPWNSPAFLGWVNGHGDVSATAVPLGRWLREDVPLGLDGQVRRLIAGLAPLADRYPLPHFRRAR